MTDSDIVWWVLINYTSYAWGVPNKAKKRVDFVNYMDELLQHIGIPNQLYYDQEGAFNNVEFIRLLITPNIKHIMVVDGAHPVEKVQPNTARTYTNNIECNGY